MQPIPRISDAEWEIMCILWEHHPITPNEVIEHLRDRNLAWHPNTARTLVARLFKKRVITRQRQGRAYLYSPLIQKEESIKEASEAFLTRVFGGSLEPMFTHFITQKGMPKSQLAELRRLVHAMDQ